MRVDTIAIGIWTNIGSPALATVSRRLDIIDLHQSLEQREVQRSWSAYGIYYSLER